MLSGNTQSVVVPNYWVFRITPIDIIKNFNKYIYDINKTSTIRYSYLNPKIKNKIMIPYMKKYSRMYKLLTILDKIK